MQRLSFRSTFVAALIAAVGVALASPAARADNITFSISGPHEWDFPIEYKPFGAFVQYGFYSDRSSQFDNDGNKSDMASGNSLLVGLSKYAYFFKIDALPDLGFAVVAIATEVSVQGSSLSASGFGDPIVSFPVVWYRPIPQLNVGASYWLSIPAGADSVSGHSWTHMPLAFVDLNLGPINLDGHAGLAMSSTVHASGAADYTPGTAFFTSWRVAAHDATIPYVGFIEPFFALDYQRTSSSEQDGVTMDNSETNQLALGGGLQFYLSPTVMALGSYKKTVSGKNTLEGNMFFFKLTVFML